MDKNLLDENDEKRTARTLEALKLSAHEFCMWLAGARDLGAFDTVLTVGQVSLIRGYLHEVTDERGDTNLCNEQCGGLVRDLRGAEALGAEWWTPRAWFVLLGRLQKMQQMSLELQEIAEHERAQDQQRARAC